MRLTGWLDGPRAVIFGRSAARDTRSDAHEAVVRRVFDGLHVPVVLDADIGHLPPQWTMIEGASAKVDVEDGRGTLRHER